MRIRKLYLSTDGSQFHTRDEAVRYENERKYEATRQLINRRRQERVRGKQIAIEARRQERSRRRQERSREKQRAIEARRQEIENNLRTRLISALGEGINPAVNIIIHNKSTIKRILTGRS
jgi:hypothetical protein